MSRIFKAPKRHPVGDKNSNTRIFLAGSIDMGKAVNWQDQVTNALLDYDVDIYNPRRDDWDSTWEQKIDNPKFNEQVTWELDNIENADIVVFYFDPSGPAPITLMELGISAARQGLAAVAHLIVCCPEGYFRKGNVDILCQRYDISQVPDLESLIAQLKEDLERWYV